MMKKEVPIYLKFPISALRVRMGYTQEKACKLLGVSETTLRKWEENSEDLTVGKIPRIESVFVIPQEYIFFGSHSVFSEKLKGYCENVKEVI